MFFRKNRKYEVPESPSEIVSLSDNLLAKVWQAKNRDGSTRLHFGFRRKSDDVESPYLSLTPLTLLELPIAIAKLASAFAQFSALPEDVRVDCGQLAVLMQKVVDLQKSNGDALEQTKLETGRILNLV